MASMQSIIKLLPDAIANQIAAGEVVQRPASVVKELLENAIDAGASRIDLLIKDAGKNLIQVTDDGTGMSAQDARMSVERHATSKIRESADLFNIHTMGFRGEALASIAAVSHTKIRTRLHNEELGTELVIAGSKIQSQESCVTPPGTTFQVKNLFFNVPARRKFLKSNPVETRHILNEFTRIALGYPQIYLTFTNEQTEVYNMPPGTLKDRIMAIFGKDFQEKIVYLEESAGYATIFGFIGDTSVYRNNRGEQFFFVNKRFIKNNYLNHAISSAYQDYLPEKTHPFYCIFIDIDPQHVDINIHPTKTEIKFDDEKTLYILLHSLVNRGLAEMHMAPTELNFDAKKTEKEAFPSAFTPPGDLTVNTFKTHLLDTGRAGNTPTWDQLLAPPSRDEKSEAKIPAARTGLFNKGGSGRVVNENGLIAQFQDTYILFQQEENLYIIHQQFAHQRILYERFLESNQRRRLACQQLLFPQTLELGAMDFSIMQEAEPIFAQLGFEIKEFGPNTLIVYGTPTEIPTGKIRDIIQNILSDIREVGHTQLDQQLIQRIARAIAEKSAVPAGQSLGMLEMKKMVGDLFECQMPGFAPNGKPTFRVISAIELEDFFV